MAYWHLKEYVRAANTFVDEAGHVQLNSSMEYSLSDIFNFYSFIRIHPLVIRQRLANAGIQVEICTNCDVCNSWKKSYRSGKSHIGQGNGYFVMNAPSRWVQRKNSWRLQSVLRQLPHLLSDDCIFVLQVLIWRPVVLYLLWMYWHACRRTSPFLNRHHCRPLSMDMMYENLFNLLCLL